MRKKFIIVDGDRGFLEGIKLNLEEIADVAVCTNIINMFVELSCGRYDVLLLDSGLLGEAGAHILQKIKQDHSQIVIVSMQLYGEEPDVREGNINQLVDMHVYKPVDFEKLLNRLGHLTEGLLDKPNKL